MRRAFVLALMGACACGGRSENARSRPEPVGRFDVPRAGEPIIIDGKCGEKSWQISFRSPTFIDAQGRRNPTTQLRATADDENLYIEVYVADIDLESKGDVVKLDVGPVHVELTPKGATAPAGVRTAVDTDDTVDNPNDDDEEWTNEVAIPWSLLGSHEVAVRALRIDVGRNKPAHALAWPPSAPALLRFDPKLGR
jgi:hypothetical protein